MQYYKINPDNPDPQVIRKAVKCLDNGGVIVYPTDTLYGLGVDPYNNKAIHKLFLIKQRDIKRPISVMLHSTSQVKEILGYNPEQIASDLEKILPGKITALLHNKYQKKIPLFEDINKPGYYIEKIGIRIPDHKVSQEIAKLFSLPITSTSANISGESNVFSIRDVISQFGNKLDLILDAGPIQISNGSTVIDFTKNPYLIMRDGDVYFNELKDKLGPDRIVRRKFKYNITFVCTGNICRSPMAEALLKKMLNKTRYKDFINVRSSGTLDLKESPAHILAYEVAMENGIDLDEHRSMKTDDNIVENSDRIFCLAQNHFAYLMKKYPQHKNKFSLLKQWQNENIVSIPSIADPVGHDFSFFKNTFNEIRDELKRVLPFILADVKRFIEFNELGQNL